jgi:hypothetical protein
MIIKRFSNFLPNLDVTFFFNHVLPLPIKEYINTVC